MVIYFSLSNDGYIREWSSTRSNVDDIELYVSDNHGALSNPEVFKYVDGRLIKDEQRQQQLIEEQEKEEEKLSAEEINEMAILELATIISGMKGGN